MLLRAMIATSSRRRYTLQEYLVVEEESAVRHELLNGEIFAMAGGTPEHAALAAALVVLLGGALRGRPCRPYSADLRIFVAATGLYTYPDAAVICGPPERAAGSPTHVTNPRVVVEVLSPSTEDYDRGEKRLHYQALASLEEYVLVAQDRRAVHVFRRRGEEFVEASYGAGESVELASVAATIAVDELYESAGLSALR